MVEFASVLEAIEARERAVNRNLPCSSGLQAAIPVETASDRSRIGRTELAAAYAMQTERARTRSTFDATELLAGIEVARSASRLRSLRRKAARLLHPDRRDERANETLLAELNARIDAALKRLATRA